MKDLKQFIKTTIREFLNENKTDVFNIDEKTSLISFYRNRIFDKVRGSDLYKKYNGSTIPYEFSEDRWKLLLQGIKESGLNVYDALNERIKRLEKEINTPISQEFNPSTGEFLGFINQEEKEQAINKTKNDIKLIKKFVKISNQNVDLEA